MRLMSKLPPEAELAVLSSNPEHPQGSYVKSISVAYVSMQLKAVRCRDMMDNEEYTADLYFIGDGPMVALIR